MSLRYVVRVLTLAALVPSGAMALGLGDIHLKSALNSPLNAEIDLTASPEELAGLKVALASRESFTRYGLDYPAYLDSVTLVPGKSADGRDVLQVRSREVVTEPFATLLVEANWARGRLVREYTVLLDPPAFTSEKASSAAGVSTPVAAPQSQAGTVERPAAPAAAPSAPSAPAPVAAPSAAASAGTGGGTYIVQRGDTLSLIAARNYPNSQRERALVALYKANPSAFDGNMNVLRSGAALQLPDAASVAAIGPGEASAEVGSQFHAWAGSHGGHEQLHLVPPSEPGAAAPAGGGSGGGDTAALQQRVTTLQQQLAESQRLLDLKNAELARLQAQINGGKPGQAPVATPVEPAKSPQEVLKEGPKPPEATATPAEAPPAAAPPSEKPKTPAPPAAAAAKQGGSFLDWLLENWYLPVGALALVLAGVFGWRFLRSRQEQEFGRTLDRLSTPPFEAASKQQAARQAETQPMRALGTKQDSSFVVEESGSHQAPRISESDLANMQSVPVAEDESVAGDTAVALDQGDPLAEADFHMAYGLYDQAADLVRIAITREPQRRDLKLKLLEVFFVWGNKDQFLQLARELAASRDQAGSGEWEKIVIMGRQIAPDDSLFAASGGLSGAASGGVDLNLEGGQNRVDFDLLGEPSIAAEAPSDAVDLDLGAALGGSDATGEMRAIGDTGVDFVLDDPARGADGAGSTREMPQSHTVTLDVGDGTHDTPTVENLQPQGLDSPTIQQKLESGARAQLASADQTAELSIDDLGLDVAGADTGTHHAADVASSPTMLTSLDEDTRNLLASAQGQGKAEVVVPDTAEMPTPPATGASGTWLFTDKDFSAVMPAVGGAAETPTELVTAVMPAADATQGVTAQVEALKAHAADSVVDLDLDSLAVTGERSGGLDLDVGHGTPETDAAFASTQRLNAEPAATDAEPATMSEVGTKLDLARAYMDMGDPEGARSILEEVLAEGSASQKTEARRLIDSLPG
ncbi:MAG TPA: FimV/HubP family polar landmark protein [Steroidobacteraceae bacterium]|nr:FimV/HubP family polar landmark protein [Steroidobacteraceae bacterium]